MTVGQGQQTLDTAIAVGRNLRLWRARHGVTQMDLARRLQMSQGYFSRIEGGKKCPSLHTLERLAAEIGVSVSDLTNHDGG